MLGRTKEPAGRYKTGLLSSLWTSTVSISRPNTSTPLLSEGPHILKLQSNQLGRESNRPAGYIPTESSNSLGSSLGKASRQIRYLGRSSICLFLAFSDKFLGPVQESPPNKRFAQSLRARTFPPTTPRNSTSRTFFDTITDCPAITTFRSALTTCIFFIFSRPASLAFLHEPG